MPVRASLLARGRVADDEDGDDLVCLVWYNFDGDDDAVEVKCLQRRRRHDDS